MPKNKNTKSKNTKNKMFNNQDILKDLESEFTRYLQEEGWHAYLHLPEETQIKSI